MHWWIARCLGLADIAGLPFSRAQWQKVRGQIEKQGRQYTRFAQCVGGVWCGATSGVCAGECARGRAAAVCAE